MSSGGAVRDGLCQDALAVGLHLRAGLGFARACFTAACGCGALPRLLLTLAPGLESHPALLVPPYTTRPFRAMQWREAARALSVSLGFFVESHVESHVTP